jgi:hypothetical protein
MVSIIETKKQQEIIQLKAGILREEEKMNG